MTIVEELDDQIAALDSICETYSEAFGGLPGGMGRLAVIELAWNAASDALRHLQVIREEVAKCCPTCQEPQHSACSLTAGCPCCDDTLAAVLASRLA